MRYNIHLWQLDETGHWTITFLKVPGCDGTFAFTAGKNGNGLGWTDPDGNPTKRTFFRWAKSGGHYWEAVPNDERPTIGKVGKVSVQKPPPPPPRDEMPILLRVFGTFKTVMSNFCFPRGYTYICFGKHGKQAQMRQFFRGMRR